MEKIKTFIERLEEFDNVVDKQAITNDMVEELVVVMNKIISAINRNTCPRHIYRVNAVPLPI